MLSKFNDYKKLTNSDMINIISNINNTIPTIKNDVIDITKSIDNVVLYKSEDGMFDISIYFRETDIYKDRTGNITKGNFKYLFKINIKSNNMRINELVFMNKLKLILDDIYDSSSYVKIGDDRINDDYIINDDFDSMKLIIKILS